MSKLLPVEMDKLRKRKAGLEHAAIMMASEGVAVPPELSDELNQLIRELAELSESSETQKPWTSFLGEEIEGFILQEKLSSGTYCHVFRAVDEKSGEACAVKIARTATPIMANPEDYFSKQAIRFHLELCQYVDVSPNIVLKNECERLWSDKTDSFVKVLSAGTHDDLFYYRMPLLEGFSLKAAEDAWSEFSGSSDNISIYALQRACSIIDDFRLSEPPQYHGNLCLDSIFITNTSLVLLSPGSFYIPESQNDSSIMITTPANYPFFDPNDLFAVGSILWQIICRQHPFAPEHDVDRGDLIAAKFREMLEYRKALNHAPLWKILNLKLPRDVRNDLNSDAELTLLKALKLKVNRDGYLTGSAGFKSGSELNEELERLNNDGWRRK